MTTPRTISLSYSRIRTFKTCPKQFYYKHVMKMTEPESPVLKRGTAVHKALEDYMTGRSEALDTTEFPNTPVHKLLRLIQELKASTVNHQAEEQYIYSDDWQRLDKWFDENAFWRAQLDWTGWSDDGTFALSLDWKTGQRRLDETQLWLNAMTKFLAEPRLQSTSEAFVWLDQGCSVDVVVFTRHDAEDGMKFVERTSDEIERMNAENDWALMPGIHCCWCVASAICPGAQ